ncbi:MAG: hypothetical protein ACOC3G_07505 [Phycisphaeraceae bacterium]
MPPWNGWYHCTANTFGTWLPGDPRGFRARRHREHVEGDYKTPPTEDFSQRHDAARRRLTREPVMLSEGARGAAVEMMRHALVDVHRLDVLAISVSGMHLHILARFGVPALKPTASRRGLGHHELREADPARYYMGIAKERSSKGLVAAGLAAPGGVWARRGKIKPVRDRTHQLRVYRYILAHASEGAAVWSFREGAKGKPTA